jgi:hypothetical protein
MVIRSSSVPLSRSRRNLSKTASITSRQSKVKQRRIHPTLKQRRQLKKEFNTCRYVWNWALDRRTKAYRQEGKSLNAILLSRELTALVSALMGMMLVRREDNYAQP